VTQPALIPVGRRVAASWPYVLLSAELVRPSLLRRLGWDIASIVRVSQAGRADDVLLVEVLQCPASRADMQQ
jgi:hypothetical protein